MFYVPWSIISSVFHCISGLLIIILHVCSDTKMSHNCLDMGTVTPLHSLRHFREGS